MTIELIKVGDRVRLFLHDEERQEAVVSKANERSFHVRLLNGKRIELRFHGGERGRDKWARLAPGLGG